jgi:hypothetical protein
MNLLSHILIHVEHWRDYNSFYNNTHIENTDITVLLISLLHHNGKINDEKLNAMFSSLRKGKLLRRINTYHCKINDQWYNDTDMFSILMDVYSNVSLSKEMTLEIFLGYLNRYHNKNKNYCLDVVYFNYIEPLINNVESYPHYNILKNFDVLEGEVLTYEDALEKKDLGCGFCCEDCDGDYNDYKRNRYQYYYKEDMVKKLKEKSKAYLVDMKTHHKNPYERLNPKK